MLELSKNRNFRIVIFSDRILFAKSTYKNHSIGAMIQTAAKKDKVKPWKMAGIYGLNQVNFPESSPDAHLPADSTGSFVHLIQIHQTANCDFRFEAVSHLPGNGCHGEKHK